MKALFKSKEDLIKKYFSCFMNVGGEVGSGYFFPTKFYLDDTITEIANKKGLKTGGKRKGNAWLYSDETVKAVCDFETFHKIKALACKANYDKYTQWIKKDVEQSLEKWINLANTSGVRLFENEFNAVAIQAFEEILVEVLKRRDFQIEDAGDSDHD